MCTVQNWAYRVFKFGYVVARQGGRRVEVAEETFKLYAGEKGTFRDFSFGGRSGNRSKVAVAITVRESSTTWRDTKLVSFSNSAKGP